MIAIIDYNAGNVRSLQFALERLGASSILTADPVQIEAAEKVIFPGQGAAANAMAKLKEYQLEALIPKLKQPVLGICLGMQLLCEATEEGDVKGLGILSAKAQRFSDAVKVPQMGWNVIFELKSALFKGIKEKEFMYLVHSFYAENSEQAIAQTDYEIVYASALQKDNFYGVQFHPEKSGIEGSKILKNFIEL